FSDRPDLKKVAAGNIFNESATPGSGLGCQSGGPKYRREHLLAQDFKLCKDDSDWSWQLIWMCWCKAKDRRGMLHFMEYGLCRRAREFGLAQGWLSLR
ncbi:unnamed protein product, partial [Polarella glacialis]